MIPGIRRKMQKDYKFKINWLCRPGWLLLVWFGLIFLNSLLGGCFKGEGLIWEYGEVSRIRAHDLQFQKNEKIK